MNLKYGFLVLIASASLMAAENPIKDCPETPNCVSTRALSPKRRIQPIILNGASSGFAAIASEVIAAMPRAKIVKATENYIHAEFTSNWLKFVDDFELFYDEEKKMIDMRSAARVGYYDFDVNLKRTKEFETGFLAKAK
jgi:uncharacterized protein (DUF1499 family)